MARQSLKNIARLLDVTNNGTPVEQSFLADLKRSIEMTEDANKHIPSKTYKPSSMNCIRNMYFQIIGAERDANNSNYTLVGICNSGTDIHERVQKAVAGMLANSIDCEYIDVAEFVKSREIEYLDIVEKKGMETKLYHKNLNISFLCDGIIRYQGKYYILEIKTESTYKWLNRSGVDEKHFNQGTAYSLAFGIDDVIFVYVNRDILDMKSFMFTPTEEMKKALVDKIMECDLFVSLDKCPPMPEQACAKFCAYCDYRGVCKNA